MFKLLNSIKERDPAANNLIEIFFLYPGFHALVLFRLANIVWKIKLHFFAKLISLLARILTGIEIHPAAKIGKNMFIDHGMGVVIGETSEIGDNVLIYHGVTLGGNSLSRGKRHPTLNDNVIIGAGAKILGPVTVGKAARVGANAVVTKNVPANCTFMGIPAKKLEKSNNMSKANFTAYGTPTDIEINGKNQILVKEEQLKNLENKIALLQKKIVRLNKKTK
tara:strand:+ start:923 stop:1588 length:666 start_codon:yes stop_codon:yes gene_type:complete